MPTPTTTRPYTDTWLIWRIWPELWEISKGTFFPCQPPECVENHESPSAFSYKQFIDAIHIVDIFAGLPGAYKKALCFQG